MEAKILVVFTLFAFALIPSAHAGKKKVRESRKPASANVVIYDSVSVEKSKFVTCYTFRKAEKIVTNCVKK